MFTFKARDVIKDLMDQHALSPGARIPHHALASDVTGWVHGQTAAEEARAALKNVFSSLEDRDLGPTIDRLLPTSPQRSFHWDRAQPPKPEDLFVAGGLASSKSDARRLLAGKGLYLNRKVPPAGAAVSHTEVVTTAQGKYLLLQKGKKTYQPLRITGLE
jgi:tyrosyl-tRNA synthetase